MQYSFKMSKMGRQIKNFFTHGCNFWWFFSDFGPIYKVINKSAQEKSPEEKKTWGDNPSLVQNITSSVSTLRQLNTTIDGFKEDTKRICIFNIYHHIFLTFMPHIFIINHTEYIRYLLIIWQIMFGKQQLGILNQMYL